MARVKVVVRTANKLVVFSEVDEVILSAVQTDEGETLQIEVIDQNTTRIRVDKPTKSFQRAIPKILEAAFQQIIEGDNVIVIDLSGFRGIELEGV